MKLGSEQKEIFQNDDNFGSVVNYSPVGHLKTIDNNTQPYMDSIDTW